LRITDAGDHRDCRDGDRGLYKQALVGYINRGRRQAVGYGMCGKWKQHGVNCRRKRSAPWSIRARNREVVDLGFVGELRKVD